MTNRIAGITVEIGGDTTKLTKALSGVNKNIAQTQTALKDVCQLLKLDPKNTELLSQKQKLLADAIRQTSDKLKTEKEALRQLESQPQTEETVRQQESLKREIIDTEQKIGSLTEEYKTFGSVAKQQAQQAAQKVKALGENIAKAGQTISGFGKNLTKCVTLPLAAVGIRGTASFAEVDKTMQLTNKTMGSTAEEAEKLNQAMKDAAANSTYGMSDAATATLNFARAGLNAAQAADALAPAMNLAAGEGGNLDTVSAGLVATINGFHGAFSEAGKYADVFAAACNNSALDVDSLSGAMSVAAPIFASAGYSVNDAALYMGVMANNGIEADKAANSLKTGIARLVSPAKEGAEKMEELGISVTNADGSMKNSIQIQKELHEAFSKLSESEQIAAASAIFGKNQMAPWLALINTAPEDVNALNESLANCAGTTDEMSSAMMSGFGGSLEKLKSSIDVLMTSVGEALAPTIQKVSNAIQGVVDAFNSFTPAQQQQIVQWGLIALAAGPVISVLGKITGGVGSLISAGSGLITHIGSLAGHVGSLANGAGNAVDKISSLGSAAGNAAAPVGSAGKSVGALSQNALGLVAAGAGILLAAGGLALLAQSAIALANAGGPAIAVMAGLVAALAGLAAGAALIAAPLTAGAAGLIAFGGAVALVGAGILAATGGIALLGSQLPVIAEYGASAASALLSIGGALTAAGAGALAAAGGMSSLLLPFAGAAATIGATDLALLALAGTFTASTLGAAALGAALAGVLSSVKSIRSDADAAGSALRDMVQSVDVITRALNGFKDLVGQAAQWFSEMFRRETPNAKSAAQGMSDAAMTAVKQSVTAGGTAVSASWTAALHALSQATTAGFQTITAASVLMAEKVTGAAQNGARAFADAWETGFSAMIRSASSAMDTVQSHIRASIASLRGDFAGTRFRFQQDVALPHFYMRGGFNARTGTVPNVGVNWYKQAMRNAVILNSPTIFGASGGKLLGGGESGSEMVVGTEHMLGMIRKAAGGDELARYAAACLPLLETIANKQTDVILDGKSVAKCVERHITRTQRIHALQGGITCV